MRRHFSGVLSTKRRSLTMSLIARLMYAALAVADVLRAEGVGIPATLPGVVERVPQDVPFVLHAAELRALDEQAQEDARSRSRAADHEHRSLGAMSRRQNER